MDYVTCCNTRQTAPVTSTANSRSMPSRVREAGFASSHAVTRAVYFTSCTYYLYRRKTFLQPALDLTVHRAPYHRTGCARCSGA